LSKGKYKTIIYTPPWWGGARATNFFENLLNYMKTTI